MVQNTQDPAQPPLFEFFEYRDAETGAGGHIRLSLKFGKSWAVESPWRHSSTSIIAQPKVYVRAVFQNTKHSDLAGSLRIVPDLAGVECIDLFLQLAKIDGYEPLKLSDTPIDNIPNGRLAVGTFFNKKNDLAMGTKILCAEKTAVQLIVAAPNKDEFSAPVNAMVLASDLFVSVERKP